ncbi:MAG: hypothetical protein V2A76_18175 [Planctomycetota bacterium]
MTAPSRIRRASYENDYDEDNDNDNELETMYDASLRHRSSRSRMLRSLVLLILAGLSFSGCTLIAARLLADPAEWQAEIYTDIRFDDVFDTALAQIRKEFKEAKGDRGTGEIESAWDFDSVSPVTRYLRRERALAEVTALEEGVELKVRVQTEVRERTGLLAADDHSSNVGWAEDRDDFERSQVLFQRIRSILNPGGPSEEFYRGEP